MFMDSVRESFRNLIRRPIQSALAIIGIICGVSGILVLSCMGYGVSQSVNDEVQKIGPGLMTIVPAPVTDPSQTSVPLHLSDAQSLTESDVMNGEVTPVLQATDSVSGNKGNSMTTIVAVNAQFPGLRPITLKAGRFFNSVENDQAKNVAVLGSTLAQHLFQDNNVVGKNVMVDNTMFEVVGVAEMENNGQTGDINNLMFLPITTALQQFSGNDEISAILIQVPDPSDVDKFADNVQNRLLQTHHWSIPTNAFTIYKQNSLLDSSAQFTHLIQLFVNGAILIAFLLGGIGVMNIMLMAANERQHEIGIYLAFGASPLMIQGQFLLEAVWISLLGVVGGYLIGTLAGLILNVYGAIPWAFHGTIYFETIAGGILLGLVFGAYPSFRAAKVKPAEAIRR